MYVEAIASNSSTNEHSMSNNVSPVSTQSAQSAQSAQSTQPAQSAQSKDAVDADTVEPQNDVVATIEANNVHKLAKKRKLAEDYLDASRCSSRDFNFIVMCDDQREMPFCCE